MSDISLKVTSDSSQAREDLSRLSRSVSNIESQTIKTTEGLARLGKQIGLAFVGFASVSSIVRLTDSLTNLDNRIALVTGRTRELAGVQRELLRVSFRTGTQIAANAAVFNKFGISLKKVGIDSTNILRATETIAQTIRLSGSSAESANAAIIQLGQGLSSGTLRGEELNSVLEQLPRLAQAIADELNIGVGELRKMGEQGKITSATVFKAIRNQAGIIAEEFKTLNSTIGTATTQLSIAFTFLFGVLDKSTGFSRTIARVINFLAEGVFDFAQRLPLKIRIIINEFQFFYRRVRFFVRSLINDFNNLLDASKFKFGLNFDFTSATRVLTTLNKVSHRLSKLFDFSIDSSGISENIGKVFNIVYQTFTASLGTLYRGVRDALGDSTAGAVFDGILLSSLGLLSNITSSFFSVVDIISDRITRVYDALFNSILPTKARLGFAFKEAFDLSYFELLDFYFRYKKVIASFSRQFDKLQNFVISIDLQSYLPSLETVKAKLKDFYDFVIGIFYNIYDLVVGNSYWPDTLNGILEYTRTITPKVIGLLRGFGRQVLNTFKSIYKSISDLEISVRLSKVITDLKQDITENLTFDNLKAQVKQLSDTFRKFIKSISFSQVGQFAERVFNKFSDFISNFKDIKVPVVTAISAFLALLVSTTGPIGKIVGLFAAVKQSLQETPTKIDTIFTDVIDGLKEAGRQLSNFADRVIQKPQEVAFDLEKTFKGGLITSSAFTGLSELFSGILGRAFGRITGNDSYGWQANLFDSIVGILSFAFNSTFRKLVTITAIIQLAKGDQSVSKFLQNILFAVSDFGNKVLEEAGVNKLIGIKNENGPIGLIAGLLFGAIGAAFFSKTVRSFLFGLVQIDFEANRIKNALVEALGPQTGQAIGKGLQNQKSTIATALRSFIRLGSIAGGVGGVLGGIFVSDFLKEFFEIKDPFNSFMVDLAGIIVGGFLGAKALSFFGTKLSELLLKKLKFVDTSLSKGGISLGKRFALGLRTGILSFGLFGGFLAGYLLGDLISTQLGITGEFERLGVNIATALFTGFVGYKLAEKIGAYLLFTLLPLTRRTLLAGIAALGVKLAKGLVVALFSLGAIKTALAGVLATITATLSLPVILTALGIAGTFGLLYSIFFGDNDSIGGKIRGFFSEVENDIRELLGLPKKLADEKAKLSISETSAMAMTNYESQNQPPIDYGRALSSEFNYIPRERIGSGPVDISLFDREMDLIEKAKREILPVGKLLSSENIEIIRIYPDPIEIFKQAEDSLSSLELGNDPLNLKAATPLIELTKKPDPLNFDSLEDAKLPEVLLSSDTFKPIIKEPVEQLSREIKTLNQTIIETTNKQISAANKVSIKTTDTNRTIEIANKAITALVPPANASTASTLAGRKIVDPLFALGEIIARGESTGAGGFNAVAGRRKGLPGLTELSIEEILSKQLAGELGAVGKFQFIGDTLRETATAARIDLSERFSPEIQERLFRKLFEERVLDKIKGKPLTDEVVNEALLNLAKVWAAVPVPEDITRTSASGFEKRIIKAGESFYSGVSGNEARLGIEEVKVALLEVLKANKLASGGYISGSGGPRSDLIPAMLSNGEFVVNAAATKRFGPILDAINQGRFEMFADGTEIQSTIQGAALNLSSAFTEKQNKIVADLLVNVEFDKIDRSTFRDINRALKQMLEVKPEINALEEELAIAIDAGGDTTKLRKDLAEVRGIFDSTLENVTDRLSDFAKLTPKELEQLFKKEQDAFAKSQVDAIKESLQSSLTNLLSGKIGIGEFGKSILNEISLELIKGFSKSISDSILGNTSSLNEVFSNLFKGNLETGTKAGNILTGKGLGTPTGTPENPLSVKIQDELSGAAATITSSSDKAVEKLQKEPDYGKLLGSESGLQKAGLNAEDIDAAMPTGIVSEQASLFDNFGKQLENILSADNPLLKGMSDLFGGLGQSISGLISGGSSGGGFTGMLSTIGSFFGIPKFADGGIVPANSSGAMPVIAHAGEIILNEAQQARIASAMQNGSSGQQVVNVNITGDISRQTKSEIYKMLPSIAEGVNSHNREKGYR